MDRDFFITRRFEQLVLLLGSNMGDRKEFLEQATEQLAEAFGHVVLHSKIYETEPWGNTEQSKFLNQALVFETNLRPIIVLETILNIEQNLGRKRYEKWGPRVIDIDIIFYGQTIYQSDILEIPHPYMHERLFVLEPLTEIIPNIVHPLFDKSVKQLKSKLNENEK
ncbi:MAG: 2-amino-4-hydroxy-6-hydroxymethyldihydropteridine diphosphokinase [Flavobacteriales bacterium]|nr:2-amino-4-hydroxy-6-hydroxymethyldihydropteridine diphosphokinase [Flavobacteriales bacterium]